LTTIRAADGYKDDYNKFWPYAETSITEDAEKFEALTKYAKKNAVSVDDKAFADATKAAKKARDDALTYRNTTPTLSKLKDNAIFKSMSPMIIVNK